MAKYYAVKHGRKTGVFNSWEETEKQVKSFSGATYKSFPTKEEAELFLKVEGKTKNRTNKIEETSEKAEAYVDGCFEN